MIKPFTIMCLCCVLHAYLDVRMSVRNCAIYSRFYLEQLLFSLDLSPCLSLHLLGTRKYSFTFVIFPSLQQTATKRLAKLAARAGQASYLMLGPNIRLCAIFYFCQTSCNIIIYPSTEFGIGWGFARTNSKTSTGGT